jgi:RimJ/RimL family protein N-acetyltransferase
MVPELFTERQRLRPPQREDLDSIYRLGSDPEVMRYITYGKTQSRREARRDLAKRIRGSRGKTGYWIAEEKKDGSFIGWFTLKPLPGTKEYEIGYRLLREKWGQGFATEGCLRLLSYGFTTLNLPQITAVAMPENAASRRVMEKIGMQLKGTGIFYNTHCVVYTLHRDSFFANQ